MARRSAVPAYKVKALAALKELRELGITEADVRRWLTPRQIHGYHTGLFLSTSRMVPNKRNIALSIQQSKSLGRRVLYHPPNQEYWWQKY